MTFEGFTQKQEQAADEILKDSALKDVGFADEGLAKKSEVIMEAVGGEYNPYVKRGSEDYPEDEKGRTIVGEEEAEKAGKRLEGSNADKWELI